MDGVVTSILSSQNDKTSHGQHVPDARGFSSFSKHLEKPVIIARPRLFEPRRVCRRLISISLDFVQVRTGTISEKLEEAAAAVSRTEGEPVATSEDRAVSCQPSRLGA